MGASVNDSNAGPIRRPNVLLVLTDQQRHDTLGCRGLTPCRTPALDALAESGISFDNAFTPAPLCVPARAALFTGLYPSQNDMMSNETGHLLSCAMLDAFRGAGYQVGYAGKWHLGESNIGNFTDRHGADSTRVYTEWCLEQGLTDGWMFNDPKTRTARTPSMSVPGAHRQELPVDKTNEAWITDFAIDLLRTRDPEKPFFQVVSYNGPHPPFMIPEPYFSMYDPAEAVRPGNFGPQPGEHPVHRASYWRQLYLDQGDSFDCWRASHAVYWGFCTMIDDFVAKVLAALDDEGLRDSTIIVFASDHGEHLGAHGLWQKMSPFDESVRVPLILSLPDGRAGLKATSQASLIDIAPTLAALCDVPGGRWEGRDLLAGRLDQSEAPPVHAMHKPLGDWMHATDWRLIRWDGYKYTWHRGMEIELFDIRNDPGECVNLASDPGHAAMRARLADALCAFLERTDDPLAPDWKREHHARCGNA